MQKSMSRPRKQIDTSTYEGRFAARLKMLREKAGLTPEAVAEAVGVARSAYFNWEAETNSPHVKYFPALASAFGVSVRTVLPEK
jgi:transcriptional regulator with XRE-family HTH domain